MEADYGGKLAEAVVKRLTGNDKISARFLYGEYFDFTPTFKIFMATNHKPKISGMDNAIWRRIKLIPFEVSFTEKQQDPYLNRKLEKELPGILAWMVEGCILWQREGLGNPPEVLEATKEYRYEMSAIETFLQECCDRDKNEMVKSSHLYGAYRNWSEKNNEYIMSTRSFGIRLAEAGFDKVRLNSGYHWLGIVLRG
jgi:putative DNA primase/helicase